MRRELREALLRVDAMDERVRYRRRRLADAEREYVAAIAAAVSAGATHEQLADAGVDVDRLRETAAVTR